MQERRTNQSTIELRRKIIESLAKNDLNISGVARELHYNRNTIVYHIINVKKETGLSPVRFYDLIELLKTYPAETPADERQHNEHAKSTD